MLMKPAGEHPPYTVDARDQIRYPGTARDATEIQNIQRRMNA